MAAAFSTTVQLLPSRAKSTQSCALRRRVSPARHFPQSCVDANSSQTALQGDRTVRELRKDTTAAPFKWREQWYAVCFEVDVPHEEPYPFSLFDTRLVLFRVSPGKFSVLDDRCSHRLAPLSEGRITRQSAVAEAQLECAYHGWSFGGCGTCTRIPQFNEGEPIPRRANVRAYSTAIELEIVWVYFGDLDKADPAHIQLPAAARNFDPKFAARANKFMRYVPYGMETLLENLADPAHVHWAHHGTSPMFNRKNGNARNALQAELVGPNHVASVAHGIPGGYLAPGTVWFAGSVPGSIELCSLFIVSPIERRQSRLLLLDMVKPLKISLLSILSPLQPRWLRHFDNNNVLDGDNILLRGVEEELADPTLWKSKYIPLAQGIDCFIVILRNWMDTHREGMPWLSAEDQGLNEKMARRQILNRFDSHTVHCTACSGALKGWALAQQMANIALKAAGMLFVCLMVGAFLGQPGLVQGTAQRTLQIVAALLLTVVVILARFRQVCLWYKAQLTFTEEARRRYLSS